jgi:NitT/TauT family transport system substrate-binding protein
MTKIRSTLGGLLAGVAATIALSGEPVVTQNEARPLGSEDPFTVAVNTTTIEATPVFVANDGPQGAGVRVINGGVRNVADGTAHAGTNAETQMLAIASGNPKIRMLLTVAEGLYRVIARKSAGIATLRDLRGKKITTVRNTSAHYHLVKMLATAGVSESEVTIVVVPQTEMAAAVGSRMADAISMWEPEAETARVLLGGDGIVFQDNSIYRELFSLYTSTDVLNDPKRRAQLVAFVRALVRAAETVRNSPAQVIPLTARTLKQPEARIANSWKFHRFPAALPREMLDVLVEEDQWMARNQQRQPLTRAELAKFIDRSVLDEAAR